MKVILNQSLIAKQGLTAEEVAKIEELHQVKWKLIQRMKRAKKPETLKSLAWKVTECEYSLQRVWRFPTDSKWHKFWELPHCKCNFSDNRERLGTDYMITSQDCPIHGWEKV